MKAYIDLEGRYFGGRKVVVSFYSEADFEAGNLAPAASGSLFSVARSIE